MFVFIREKLIRLEHQNKVLTLQLEEAENEKTHVLEANLDVATERVNRLQTENRYIDVEIGSVIIVQSLYDGGNC